MDHYRRSCWSKRSHVRFLLWTTAQVNCKREFHGQIKPHIHDPHTLHRSLVSHFVLLARQEMLIKKVFKSPSHIFEIDLKVIFLRANTHPRTLIFEVVLPLILTDILFHPDHPAHCHRHHLHSPGIQSQKTQPQPAHIHLPILVFRRICGLWLVLCFRKLLNFHVIDWSRTLWVHLVL